ncbi:ATP-binding cassette domain-containing protein [Psychrobacter sp. I-STPA10]|uniref:ATP-binding cassette domain-containing protein n=1 Tax=Psychrobacter sp. I-STPA10 TaxID=2585769 RepID=UPI001E3567FF|nr:ATP-binding cassette domain-containing protein [Psychrobacter sp. I-STPA10]
MSQIRLVNISKIYDASPSQAKKVLAMLADDVDSTDIRQQTGYSVGLYDINLTIESGEMHCIMGLSGSGKSTLVRHINRLIDPSTGEIWVDNPVQMGAEPLNILTLSDKPLQKFRQHNVSMVFQHFGLVPHLTVIQNVAYGLRVKGIQKAKRHEIARYWLNEVGLDGLGQRYPDELSGGMQQRVGLARALAVDTPIMLMDEAFSALDPLIRNQLQDQLLELQEKLHKTIVFITHDIDEAIKVGQRISILNKGRLIQTGTPEQLRNNPVNDYVAQFMHVNG